jgi:hypothetical protein
MASWIEHKRDVRQEVKVVGGLIQIAGIELSAIDALLCAWFVLAGLSTAYVPGTTSSGKTPRRR